MVVLILSVSNLNKLLILNGTLDCIFCTGAHIFFFNCIKANLETYPPNIPSNGKLTLHMCYETLPLVVKNQLSQTLKSEESIKLKTNDTRFELQH